MDLSHITQENTNIDDIKSQNQEKEPEGEESKLNCEQSLPENMKIEIEGPSKHTNMELDKIVPEVEGPGSPKAQENEQVNLIPQENKIIYPELDPCFNGEVNGKAMQILTVLKKRSNETWENIELRIMLHELDGEVTLEPFMLLNTYDDYGFYAYNMVLGRLNQFKDEFQIQLVHMKNREYYEKYGTFAKFSGEPEVAERFLFNIHIVGNEKFNLPPTQAMSDPLEVFLVYGFFIAKMENLNKINKSFLNQVPKLPLHPFSLKQSFENYVIRNLLEDPLLKELKAADPFFTCMMGKLTLWNDIMQSEDYTFLNTLNKLFDKIPFKDIFSLILSEDDVELRFLELSSLKIKISIDCRRKLVNDKSIFFDYVNNLPQISVFDKESLSFLLEVIEETSEINKTLPKMIEAIIPYVVSNENITFDSKLRYLIKMYGQSLTKDTLEKLEKINSTLSKSIIDPNDHSVYSSKKSLNEIFEKPSFWKDMSKEMQIKFYKFITSKDIVPMFKKAISSSSIKTFLNNHLKTLFSTRDKEDINFLTVIFIEQYDSEMVGYTPENMIESFLNRNFLERRLVSKAFCSHFLTQILFPFFLKNKPTDEIMGKFLRGWKDLSSVDTEEIFKAFDELFTVFEKSGNFNQKTAAGISVQLCYILLEKDSYFILIKKLLQKALLWKSIVLKTTLINYLLDKLETSKDSKSFKTSCIDDITEILLSDKHNSNDFISYTLERVSLILGKEVKFEDIRDAILKDPSSAKLYVSLLLNQDKNKDAKTVLIIKNHMTQIINSILDNDITFAEIYNIRSYSKQNYEVICNLLRTVNSNVDFDHIFQIQYHQADKFKAKTERLLYFLEQFGHLNSIEQRKTQLENLMRSLMGRKLSGVLANQKDVNDISLEPELEKFVPLSIKLEKIILSPFFKYFLVLGENLSENEVIDACEKAYKDMNDLFEKISLGLLNSTLKMNILMRYFSNIPAEYIDVEINKIADHAKMEPKVLEILKDALRLYAKHPQLIHFSKPLIELDTLIPMKNDILKVAVFEYTGLVYTMADESETEGFPVKDFVQVAKTLVTELEKSDIKSLEVDDPINQILFELSASKELCEYITTVSRESIAELKDFLNDQEENFINTKVIKNFEYVWDFRMKVIQKSNGLKDFVHKCREFVEKKEWIRRGCDEICGCIRECVTLKNQIERAFIDMNHREASYKFRIKEIMENSLVYLISNSSGKKDVAIDPHNYTIKQLNDFRDKCLLIINSTRKDEVETVVNLETLKQFTKFVEALNITIDSYDELEKYGFFEKFIFSNQTKEVEFKITKCNFDILEEYKTNLQNYTAKWKEYLDSIHTESYIFAHFYGRQLQKLHRCIIKDKGANMYLNNLVLWSNLDPQQFRTAISDRSLGGELDFMPNESPFDQLNYLKELLDSIPLQQNLEQMGNELDSQKNNIDLLIMPKTATVLAMLCLITKNQNLDLKLNQVLFCHHNTNPLEINSFLQQLFLNGKKLPYFIVGIENLTAKLQMNFCEMFESKLKSLKRFLSNLNLIVISSNTNEKIYNYLYHHEILKANLLDGLKNLPSEKECKTTLTRMIQNFQIVASSTACLGKTHYISQQCKMRNLFPIYFPIAGNITKERIGQRLNLINIKPNTALILQIYHVVDKDVLDEILFQLIFFRSLKSEEYLFFPEHKFHLFIELENLIGENYLESIQSLAIFRDTGVRKEIKEAKAEDLIIDNKDIEFHFVLTYLNAFREGTISGQDIDYKGFLSKFRTNDIVSLKDHPSCRVLIDEYFFKPLKSFKPSFIQLRFFIEILYSALRTFSGAPWLEVQNLHYAFENLNPEVIIKTLRTEFVRILIENAREFVKRTISIEEFLADNMNQQNTFSQQLKNFPLLIMKIGEESEDCSYSFIYDDVKKVPKEIKQFVLIDQYRQGHGNAAFWNSENELNNQFSKNSLLNKSPEQLLDILKLIAGSHMAFYGEETIANAGIENDNSKYALTLDNFYKMCLIIQRMRSKIPIVIMGETGVGKTALIKFLVEQIYKDELMVFNIHAGIHEKELIEKINLVRSRSTDLLGKRLWVFFDEFNTSDEVGYIAEILSSRRFLGEPFNDNVIFLGACNPFRKRQIKAEVERAGIEKNKRLSDQRLIYTVLPPPESLTEVMWDYQELKETETFEYIKMMLDMDYKIDRVVRILSFTHSFIKEKIEKSAVSLRDVDRFRKLYHWFEKTMPKQQSLSLSLMTKSSNFLIDRKERAFILTISFVYYFRFPSTSLRKEYLDIVEERMGYRKGYMLEVMENEQLDLLSRMEIPPGIALNKALRENVFSTFVCLMNKIPIIIVGMPGCSKSLAFRLLTTNLRGQNSYEEYFRSLDELSIVQFQGSESVTSEGVEKVFERALRSLNLPRVIPTILFDEIGLAEVSVHNPLKVLHSHLERPKVSFIGISNWELDAAKMGRFLIVSRPLPGIEELEDTVSKIFESNIGNGADRFTKFIKILSNAYFEFVNAWRQKGTSLYPDFFGLRDFYSLIKYISNKIKTEKVLSENRQAVVRILRRGVERNFDGQANSVNLFLEKVRKNFYDHELEEKDELDVLSLVQENLDDANSRCLLLIIRGEALIHLVSQNVNVQGKNVITIHGSTFAQDKQSEQYNIRVLSDVIEHVEKGNIIIFKDVNNSVQTSLYDLYNKSYQRIGGKDYCRVAVGANYNPKCLVHPNFNSIVYINEARLGDVDPPFLNRFEKHYLTLDRFLGNEEILVLKTIQEWLEKITAKYFNAKGPLKRDNFIINSSEEVLASLCIRNLQLAKVKNNERDPKFIEEDQYDPVYEAIQQCKRDLIRNATIDFKFLIETNSDITTDTDEYNLICNEYKSKYTTPIREICKQANSKLIIFTYEQNISKDYSFGSQKMRTIKMVQMKCESDLKYEIESYFQGLEELCVIKVDYETEAAHLPLLLFIIENSHKMFTTQGSKDFIVILYCSRLSAVMSDQKPLQSISFLNGWSQMFFETLSESKELRVEECPPFIGDLVESAFFNLKDLIASSIQNSIKRFNFRFESEAENAKYMPIFIRFLLQIQYDESFQEIAHSYIKLLSKKAIDRDWRMEILESREIANMALSVLEALKLYTIDKIEDYLSLFLKNLFENDAFVCIFPSFGSKILKEMIPDLADTINLLSTDAAFIKQILLNSLEIKIQALSKAPNSINITLGGLRLFPFSKIDEKFIFDEQSLNDDESLYFIAKSLNESELTTVITKKEVEQAKLQGEFKHEYNSKENIGMLQLNDNKDAFQMRVLETKFKAFFRKKTILNKVNPENNRVIDLLTQINNDVHGQMKELYLFDMRNFFLRKVLGSNLKLSVFFDKLMRLFLSQKYTVEEYLLTLIKGENLWKNVLHIYEIITSAISDKNHIEKMFIFDAIKGKEGSDDKNFADLQISYVKSFLTNCGELFQSSEESIKLMKGLNKYNTLLEKCYYWINNLQKEFSRFDVNIPPNFILWKNLINLMKIVPSKDIEELYKDLALIIQNQNLSVYIAIDDFVENLKKNCSLEHKNAVAKFQAEVLYTLWIKSRPDKKDEVVLAERLTERINYDEYFPNFCLNIIKCLININNPTNAYKELASINNILSRFCKSIEKNNQCDNLSMIIADYFDAFIQDPKIFFVREGESLASEQLNANFPKFLEYWIIIENQQYQNQIQLLYIMGFFRRYVRYYANCIWEQKNYPLLRDIDMLFCKNSFLAKNLAIYTLKLLRTRFMSLAELKKFLFEVKRMLWVDKFEEFFAEEQAEILNIPVIENINEEQSKIEELWVNLEESNFLNEELFSIILELVKGNPAASYMFLNMILMSICKSFSSKTTNKSLIELINKRSDELKLCLNPYQISLINYYIKLSAANVPDFLSLKLPNEFEQFNLQIIILNIVNWLASLNTFESPLTSLFFVKESIPNNFSDHFNNQFVIAGLDNPYIQSAQKSRETCRYKGIYICSNECDYIYTVEGCGWTIDADVCPFCHENIKNLKDGAPHQLAREDKGARRLGPKLLDWDEKYYVSNLDFQKDEDYWRKLEDSVDCEIDKIREKKILNLNEENEEGVFSLKGVMMTGYNSAIEARMQGKKVSRIKNLTGNFLNLLLDSSLYVMITLEWIRPQEISKIMSLENILDFLKGSILKSIENIRTSIQSNDYNVWIIAMIQKTANLIQMKKFGGSDRCKNRDLFEKAVEELLENHLGEKKVETIKAYKKSGEVNVQKFDSILCEQQSTSDYCFLKVLRLNKPASLDNMLTEYGHKIQANYPALYDCIKSLEEIKVLCGLIHIVRFPTELMRMINFQMLRKDAETIMIGELIEQLQNENLKSKMNDLFLAFINIWNNLNFDAVYYQGDLVGKIEKYDKDKPVIAFLVDNRGGKNLYGKLLAVLISLLCEKQNNVIAQISNKVKTIDQFKDSDLVNNRQHIGPQEAGLKDILNLDETTLSNIILENSFNIHKYGNSIPVYDLEAIQLKTVVQILEKKMLVTDINLYINVQFIGEPFLNQSKKISYITEIKQLGLNQPIPNLLQLENKLKTIKENSPNQFYSLLKQMLGSLEKIMIFYKTLVDKDISLSNYIKKNKFTTVPIISDEQPIKDYDINCITALYEFVEKMIIPYIWKIIPETFKRERIAEDQRLNVMSSLSKIKEQKSYNKTMPNIFEFDSAISRFLSRYLLIGDFEGDASLTDCLFTRQDVWPYPFDEESVKALISDFPDIKIAHIYDLHLMIEDMLNPPKEEKIEENKPNTTEILPGVRINNNVQKKKPQKQKVYI